LTASSPQLKIEWGEKITNGLSSSQRGLLEGDFSLGEIYFLYEMGTIKSDRFSLRRNFLSLQKGFFSGRNENPLSL